MRLGLLVLLLALTPGQFSELAGPAVPAHSLPVLASWYGKNHQGRLTASGERFNRYALTAAHPTLPFGTWLQVTNPGNGRMVIVRVNDRGPSQAGRSLDLSEAAAHQLNLIFVGVAPVLVTVLPKEYAHEHRASLKRRHCHCRRPLS